MELNELFTALAICQGELENATKDSNNPFFKSKYADLAEVINAAKLPMSKNGLSIIQLPTFQPGIVSVKTILGHKSGQFIESTISTPIVKQDPQSIGSAITYMRRYSYSAIIGIAQEDDDGNKASGNDQPQKELKKNKIQDESKIEEFDLLKNKRNNQTQLPSENKSSSGVIVDVMESSGVDKNEKPYTKYGIVIMANDNIQSTYGTFSKTIGDNCKKNKGKILDFTFTESEVKGKIYKNLVSVNFDNADNDNKQVFNKIKEDDLPF